MSADFIKSKEREVNVFPSEALRFLRLRAEGAIPAEIPENTQYVLVLGNFDGVHPAHRALIEEAFSLRDKLQGKLSADCEKRIEVAVWYFNPPSLDFIPGRKAGHLTTAAEKRTLFAGLGVPCVFEADFPALRNLSPAVFFEQILVNLCRGAGFVCGYNFRFGKNASGDAALLKSLAGDTYPSVAVPPVCDEAGTAISASRIRALLSAGKPDEAETLLGYPYSLSGRVLHGKALGHTLGFPTANLAFENEKFVPKCGVYFSSVQAEGRTYKGITNIGRRPTTDGDSGEINCETYIFNYQGNLYEKEVTVFLLAFHREEHAFSSLENLQTALSADLAAAKQYFHI